MTLSWIRTLAWLLLAVAAAPLTAGAVDWQTYLASTGMVHEIDVDSVHVVDGLVYFRYREYLDSGRSLPPFDRPIDAVADCEGRRHADTSNAPLQLRPVYEHTQSAFQIDFACSAAGLSAKTHVAVAQPDVRDLRRFTLNRFIDANSLKVDGSLVFYRQFSRLVSFAKPSVLSNGSDAVVDCTARRGAEVAGTRFVLRDIDERYFGGAAANLACKLAKLPTTQPRVVAEPIDWSAPANEVMAGWLHSQIDSNSLEPRGNLIYFTYDAVFTVNGMSFHYPAEAEVDCNGRRRSDIVDEKENLFVVEDGSRGARQLEYVCELFAKLAAAAAAR